MAAARPSAGRTIEASTTIDAPADAVWRLIADVPGWGRWNPLYPSAAGTLRVGEVLDLTLALPGLKPQRVRAEVTGADPGARMAYRTRAMGGLVRGDRYVLVRALGPGRCEVTNGEGFGGLLGGLVAGGMRARVAQGFADMNAALKTAAEAG